jgi:hypothetical protein
MGSFAPTQYCAVQDGQQAAVNIDRMVTGQPGTAGAIDRRI